MVKLFEGEKKDPKAIHESLQKGYGIEHPERISGYAGFFYELGDVYASDAIYQRMETFKGFKDFVLASLKEFEEGEYGDISEVDLDTNIENRWLFGIPKLFGRYDFRLHKSFHGDVMYQEIIRIRQRMKKTCILYDDEDETEIIDSQEHETHKESKGGG